MRFVALLLLLIPLLAGVRPAAAFDFALIPRPGTRLDALQPSDTVAVDLFMDATLGLETLTLSVLHTAPGLRYEPEASTRLAVIHPAPPASYGTTGSNPGYILYTGHTIVYPVYTPPQASLTPPPGFGQVDVRYEEDSGGSSDGIGDGIWIASLVFFVEPGFEGGTILATLEAEGDVLRANGEDLDPADVGLREPLMLTAPEPGATAVGLAVLASLAVLRRRER